METIFKKICIKECFCFRGCLADSHWLKISETRAINIGGDNGRYELHQQKKFIPEQIVYKMQYD